MSRKNTNEEEEEVSSGVDEDEVGKGSDEEVDDEDGDNEESDQEIGGKTGRGRRMELRNRKSRSQKGEEGMEGEGMKQAAERMEENEEVEKGEEKMKSFNPFDTSLFGNGLIPNLKKSLPCFGMNPTEIPFPSFPLMVPTLPKEVAIMPRSSSSFRLVALVHLSKGKQLGPYEAKVHKERSDGRWKVSYTLLPYFLLYITVFFSIFSVLFTVYAFAVSQCS